MLPRLLTCVLLFAASAACCQPTASGATPPVLTALPRQLSPAEQSIAKATPAFGLALLKVVNGAFADKNVFISPLSASMALGMVLNGASGTTYNEMRAALGLAERPLAELNAGYQGLISILRGLDRSVDFRIANSIWYEQSFGPAIEAAFLREVRTFFDAQVAGIDSLAPPSVTRINDWVKAGTNGKIDRIIDQIPAKMVLYLVNATYFKGAWRDRFDPKRTSDAPFTTHKGQQVTVRMMARKGGLRTGTSGGATVVELPYGGDAFVMTIALPPYGMSINDFVAGLTPATWQAMTVAATPSELELLLPKFKLTWEDSLNEYLKALGMRRAFVQGGADFTRLSRTMGAHLFLSEVKQKTFVDVNEEGTEAAAVTSATVLVSGPLQVRVDRPFVFAIRERLSGTIVFIGKVVHPSA